MPLIPYPDVPSLPGVPPVPVDPAPAPPAPPPPTIADTSAYTDTSATQWKIVDTTGDTLLSPDAVIDFEYRGESKVATHPVEQGSFAAYNKVAMPFDIRATLACNGNGEMTRDRFLSAIDSMKQSLDLVTVVTPDAVYSSCNLVHVDYRREAKQGVSLIMAQLWFQEIRQGGKATITTAKPDGARAQQNGQVSPVAPTTQQQAAYNKTGVK